MKKQRKSRRHHSRAAQPTMAQINPKLIADFRTAADGGTLVIRSLGDSHESYILEDFTPARRWYHVGENRQICFDLDAARYTQPFRPVELVLFPLLSQRRKSVWVLHHWGIHDDDLEQLRRDVEDSIVAL